LGDGVVVFEVQQNSDVTFRLYDWGHVDAKTGQPRPLQVDQALACIDFADGAAGLVSPVVEATTPVERERLFHCEHFRLWRLHGNRRLPSAPRVCRACWYASRAAGQVEHDGATYAVGKGDVWLLPAVVGACAFQPREVGNCE
jgi:mannose-6-phosphate isomerase